MRRRAFVFLLTVGAAVFVGTLWGRGALAGRSGWTDRYQPTRLEWLALRLQASYGTECYRTSSSDWCTSIHYVPRFPDEILVLAEVRGPVPLSTWTDDIETARKLIAEECRALGATQQPRITVMRGENGGGYQPIRGE